MTSPAIIGWSHGQFGRSEHPLPVMMAAVARDAVADAGLELADIDVIHVGVYNNGLSRQGFEAALLGVEIPELALTPAHRHENACATGSTAVFAAHDSIAAGRHRIALVIGAEKMTQASGHEVNETLLSASYRDEEEHYKSFAGVFGEIAARYFERFGDHSDTLARIASKNHANGTHNPLAHMRRDLGFEFCSTVSEKNPYVAEPLRRTDCSLVSDGAVALVLAADEVAGSAPQAVRWRGMGNANDAMPLSRRDPLEMRGAGAAMRQALKQAGIGIYDLDLLETHDCFTIAELLEYEAFGLAGPGLGHRLIDEGVTAVDGELPVNPSGGLKAKGHPIGATGVSMHALAAAQLTGRASGIQIESPELAGVFNMGGAAVSNFASVLERVR
ncbi:acetyl-CoA C-acetyltransferase [Brevibacterium sanguinis]|uniref:Acetyl-CoA C-acetyltransferase n=2 Tax=Brevibacterium TaxID=1696 RepID=A0A366IHN2_9MICO|nr:MULTISPECIES: thiolase domain-containing protein [Brevibacterium]RBP65063.1 acetyl-CoA C-acetyltransferase [Brevibacterium sanguinis]RBP71326.1 acetyl-CoA C-acetyltransferase [Brevibacterium celere]